MWIFTQWSCQLKEHSLTVITSGSDSPQVSGGVSCQPVSVLFSSVVLSQVTHVCVGEEVTGGDATDCLVDVHGCDLSGSPANPNVPKLGFWAWLNTHREICFRLPGTSVVGFRIFMTVCYRMLCWSFSSESMHSEVCYFSSSLLLLHNINGTKHTHKILSRQAQENLLMSKQSLKDATPWFLHANV